MPHETQNNRTNCMAMQLAVSFGVMTSIKCVKSKRF